MYNYRVSLGCLLGDSVCFEGTIKLVNVTAVMKAFFYFFGGTLCTDASLN